MTYQYLRLGAVWALWGYYHGWHSQHVYVFQGISLYYDYHTNASVALCRFMFPLFYCHLSYPALCPFGFKF